MDTLELQTITTGDLDQVNGGGWVGTGLRVAGRVGSKFVPFVNAASTIYSGYEAGSAMADARNRGDGWGSTLWQGAKAFVVGR